jgi:midasin
MLLTSTSQMHMRLLAYYRILVACPHAPVLFQWSHEVLLKILSSSGVDNGIRWLFVRCYALHTGMSEAQREDLQMSILGPSGEENVVIEAGRSLDGSVQLLDGWLLPVLEVQRVREHRQAMLDEHDFYRADDCLSVQRINLERLTFVFRFLVYNA